MARANRSATTVRSIAGKPSARKGIAGRPEEDAHDLLGRLDAAAAGQQHGHLAGRAGLTIKAEITNNSNASVATTVAGTVDSTAFSQQVTLTNNGSRVAFFLRATIHKGASGDELALVTWSDDYVTIWPGESVTLQAGYRTADLAGATPNVQVAGVNVGPKTVRAAPR